MENPTPVKQEPRIEEDHGIKMVTKATAQQANSANQEERRDKPELPFHVDVQTSTRDNVFKPNFVNINRDEEHVDYPRKPAEPVNHPANNDQQSMKIKAVEREQRLRELSLKLKTPEGLLDMEKEPAYLRRNMPLE
jgi:hypothetical protein